MILLTVATRTGILYLWTFISKETLMEIVIGIIITAFVIVWAIGAMAGHITEETKGYKG